MTVFPTLARGPREQLSGAEDGVAVFGPGGVCRFDVRSGGSSVGAFVVTSTSPASPFVASRDYWFWRADATPWPQVFELHHAPGMELPSVTPQIHLQLLFSGSASTQDLSASALTVWRVKRGELVQQTPIYEDLGFFTRNNDGSLSWYADSTPAPGFFGVPPGSWLRLVQISNTNLVVQAVHAAPGAIS